MACEACVHAAIFEVVALGDIEDKSVAADVNLTIFTFSVVLADLLEGPGCLAIIFIYRRLA